MGALKVGASLLALIENPSFLVIVLTVGQDRSNILPVASFLKRIDPHPSFFGKGIRSGDRIDYHNCKAISKVSG